MTNINIPETDRVAHTNPTFSNIKEWLGIPYATADRFQSPEMVDFNTNLDYSKSGPASLQPFDAATLQSDKGLSENCLNLSIWAPKKIEKPLPVVVYYHGGGFIYGSNSQITSVPSGLAASGRVIGVSVNFRLGALGWLSLSQYGGQFENATNLGLQDMIMSLKWIQKYISSFGGDPDQVTLTGHSGGAFMSAALLAVPSAKGLFKRMALFSGGTTRIIPTWWAEQYADTVINKLGVQDNLSKLLTIDPNLINKVAREVIAPDMGERVTVDNIQLGIVDDHDEPNGIIASTPTEAIAKGSCSDIDIIFSNTTNEFDWWVKNDPNFNLGSYENVIKHFAKFNRLPISRVRSMIDFYKKDRTPAETRAALFTDYVFALPNIRDAQLHAQKGGRSYLLSVGPADNAPAVHGTDMYAIVGQRQPNASQDQIKRDTTETNIVLDFACQNYDKLWQPISDKLVVKELGHRPYNAEIYYKQIEKLFAGIPTT